jgi:hypothetical protein
MNELNHGAGKGDCDRTRNFRQQQENYAQIKSNGTVYATVVLSHPCNHRRRFYYGSRHLRRVGETANTAKVG